MTSIKSGHGTQSRKPVRRKTVGSWRLIDGPAIVCPKCNASLPAKTLAEAWSTASDHLGSDCKARRVRALVNGQQAAMDRQAALIDSGETRGFKTSGYRRGRGPGSYRGGMSQ